MINRITILGGSSVYIPEFVLSIISKNLNVQEIVLFGRAGKKLQLVAEFSQRLIKKSGFPAKVTPLTDLREAVKVAISDLKRAEDTIKDIQGLISNDSVMTNELKTTLRELSAASRSIRVWADYLERHPEALIRGKGGYRR